MNGGDGRRTSTAFSARGVGLGTAGLVFGGLGVGLATPILVYCGVFMLAVFTVSCVWMLLSVNTFVTRFPYARREVIPHPLTAGVPGTVTVTIQSDGSRSTRWRRAITQSLDIREQAAAELTGGMGTKASVVRTTTSLTLTYSLLPSKRGRWPLGPALVHTADPFGVLWADTAVGDAELIPVWPTVVDLSGTAGALMGHADRIVLGARTPSPDDASLRDYREGDDMRRVHWASSARRGTMLVRSDERAGRRPATVLVDLPRDPHALEWAISAAASIALSVLTSGHPVRLLGAGINPDTVRHLGEHGTAAGRASLLNQTVDLVAPPSAAAATNMIARAARQASHDASHGEVIVAIVDPLDREALDALVPIGDTGRAWALVRTTASTTEAARDTARALRRSGWRVTTVTTTSDLTAVWTALLTAGDIE
ncbi:MAG: DUF58 domain-containing protein [Actinomycetota bacterium]